MPMPSSPKRGRPPSAKTVKFREALAAMKPGEMKSIPRADVPDSGTQYHVMNQLGFFTRRTEYGSILFIRIK